MPGHPGRGKTINSAQTPIATDRPHAWGASMTASVFASPASLPGTYRAGFDSLPKAAFYAVRGMRRFFPGESFAAGRPNLAAGDPGDSQNRRNPSPRGASPWMRVSKPRLGSGRLPRAPVRACRPANFRCRKKNICRAQPAEKRMGGAESAGLFPTERRQGPQTQKLPG